MSSECLCGFVPSSAGPEGGEKGRDFWGSQRQALPGQASPRILGLSSLVGWPPEGSLHCWGTVILFKPRGHPRALDLSPLVVPQKLPFIHLLAGHSSFSGKLCHPLGSRDGQSWYGHGSRGGRNQQQRQRGEGCGSGFSGCTKSLLYFVRAPFSNMLEFFWGGATMRGFC